MKFKDKMNKFTVKINKINVKLIYILNYNFSFIFIPTNDAIK